MKSAADWVETFDLKAHPEGGFYAETYRSKESIPVEALQTPFQGSRSQSTAIYYLLEAGHRSAFHRVQSDEMWHHYAGGRLEIPVIHPDGRLEIMALGSNPEAGESFQLVVPAGAWFGAYPVNCDYVLAGCTMAPGFDFADFELADRNALLASFPQHQEIVLKLT